MYPLVVAIDLETTGTDPLKDEVVEFGAVVLREGKLAERYSAFVKPSKPMPLHIQRLTGITPAMLAGARHRDEVLPEFLEFLKREDAHYIAHNAAFDRSFLMAATKSQFNHKMIDTVGLSRIIYPMLPSHSLGYLAEALKLPASGAHRALADCETVLFLWQRLAEESKKLPPALVAEFNYLLAPLRDHPYHEYFQYLAAEQFEQRFGREEGGLATLFRSFKEIIEDKPEERELDGPHGRIDEGVVHASFESGGELSKAMPNFEARPGQADMAAAVAAAMNKDQHLLVEAPTGIGKSLAYLLPAVRLAMQEGFPVIISTNTKNLQTQLFEKDIPFLREALGVDFNGAIIKGRGNYLCLRKLLYVTQSATQELDREERMQMLPLLSWAAKTSTGDISECVLTGRPNFGGLWAKLRTLGDECAGKNCKLYNRCFLRRARALSLNADVVVANHALVFAEMNMESSVLPEYRHIVFDEAHNLEEAATSHLTVEVSGARVMQILSRLFRGKKRGEGGTGLVPSILFQLRSPAAATVEPSLMDAAQSRCEALMQACAAAAPEAQPFFHALAGTLGRGGKEQVRFAQGRKLPDHWDPAQAAKEKMVSTLAQVMRAGESLFEALTEIPSGIPHLRDLQRELEAALLWIKELVGDVEFVLAGSEANYVYWVERTDPQQGGARAMAAPLSIAEIMNDQVYARKRSCVFCSATMTVRNSFDFLSSRLGFNLIPKERLTTMTAPTPFNYAEQCQVLIPSFLPEPGEAGGDYPEQLSKLMAEVYRRTRGRGLMLFTSYEMLKKCYAMLEEEMRGDGYALLAQGQSGSREQVTATFIRDIHSILLGTHSFWEGVDVVGESLSCLTITRLPFAVFTEPVIEARCEQLEAKGLDPFINYSVPSAVIRFRQGFGRLIRGKSDRGVVIIADRRVLTKRYGRIFLDSLPTKAEPVRDAISFLEAVEEFFDGGR